MSTQQVRDVPGRDPRIKTADVRRYTVVHLDNGEKMFVAEVFEGELSSVWDREPDDYDWSTAVMWVWAASPEEAIEAVAAKMIGSLGVRPWTVVAAVGADRDPVVVACVDELVPFEDLIQSAEEGLDQYPVVVYADGVYQAVKDARARVAGMLVG